MNKRAIILDFTSLLDVIMIILFFFILFSHFETEEAKIALQAAEQSAIEREEEADALLEEAGELLGEAEEKNKKADEKLKEAEAAEERAGANAAAITEFSQNRNIQIKLKIEDGGRGWSLDVFRDDEKTASVEKSGVSAMSAAFLEALSDMGCKKDDTLLCTFVYDGGESGTNSACRDVSEMFGEVKKQYEHFFYSEIDTSLYRGG